MNQSDREDVHVHENRISESMQAGDLARAMLHVDTALRDWPDLNQFWARKVTIYRNLGELGAARDVIENKAPEEVAQSAGMQLLLLDIDIDSDDIESASRFVNKLRTERPWSVLTLIAAGRLALAVGNCEDTLDEIMFRKRPQMEDNPQFITLLTRLLSAVGRHEEAIAVARKAFEKKPSDNGLALHVAGVYSEAGLLEKAEEWFAERASSLKGIPYYFVQRAHNLELIGQSDKALELLMGGAARFVDSSVIHLELWRQLARAGQSDKALELLMDGAARFVSSNAIHFELWRQLARAGRIDEAAELAERHLEQNQNNTRTTLEIISFLMDIGYEENAQNQLRRLKEKNDNNPFVNQKLGEILLNKIKDPEATLEIMGYRQGQNADNLPGARLIARCLEMLGYLEETVSVMEAMYGADKLADSGILDLARLHFRLGRSNRAIELLNSKLRQSAGIQYTRLSLWAEIEMDRGNLDRVEELLAEAEEKRRRGNFQFREQNIGFHILNGEYDKAWETCVQRTEFEFERSFSGKLSNKPRNSIYGQIVNEYLLYYGKRDPLGGWSESHDTAVRRRHYLEEIHDNPSNTPAALNLIETLRLDGKLYGSREKAGSKPIPRIVHQFWDQPEPPAAIRALMDSNMREAGDFKFQLFNTGTAIDYMKERDEREALRGFQLAPEPAGKADIFRLVVLWHEGGIYVDADDRVVAPLEQLLHPGIEFVCYQEIPYGTIGNNVMATVKHHPIIRAALQDASRAFLGPRGESLWLSTGPGATTRAVVAQGLDDGGLVKPGICIMPYHQLVKNVVPHVRLPYKSTSDYWYASFSTSRK